MQSPTSTVRVAGSPALRLQMQTRARVPSQLPLSSNESRADRAASPRAARPLLAVDLVLVAKVVKSVLVLGGYIALVDLGDGRCLRAALVLALALLHRHSKDLVAASSRAVRTAQELPLVADLFGV